MHFEADRPGSKLSKLWEVWLLTIQATSVRLRISFQAARLRDMNMRGMTGRRSNLGRTLRVVHHLDLKLTWCRKMYQSSITPKRQNNVTTALLHRGSRDELKTEVNTWWLILKNIHHVFKKSANWRLIHQSLPLKPLVLVSSMVKQPKQVAIHSTETASLAFQIHSTIPESSQGPKSKHS